MEDKNFFPNVSFDCKVSSYKPIHEMVRNASFPFKESKHFKNNLTELEAIKEANLVDAIARVAEQNGVGINDVNYAIKFIFRMLKSKSQWAE